MTLLSNSAFKKYDSIRIYHVNKYLMAYSNTFEMKRLSQLIVQPLQASAIYRNKN